ncbi:hypothetical protein CEXT_485301 [Caerostris extrusa]|uniref:Uncharacterized protein n=1 Tax=Caerostris extrusa TaxID=172846 RepID=A0AAV4NE11_CAEEX|nr:hypothetical protein CEXT_485301 [Caerostris extrusa]
MFSNCRCSVLSVKCSRLPLRCEGVHTKSNLKFSRYSRSRVDKSVGWNILPLGLRAKKKGTEGKKERTISACVSMKVYCLREERFSNQRFDIFQKGFHVEKGIVKHFFYGTSFISSPVLQLEIAAEK